MISRLLPAALVAGITLSHVFAASNHRSYLIRSLKSANCGPSRFSNKRGQPIFSSLSTREISSLPSTILSLRCGASTYGEGEGGYYDEGYHRGNGNNKNNENLDGDYYGEDPRYYDERRQSHPSPLSSRKSQGGSHRDDPYHEGEEDYNAPYESRTPRRANRATGGKQGLESIPGFSTISKGNRKIGSMLVGGGVVFTLLGISLFFNKTLMRLGNLLLCVGVPILIGPGRTAGYFLQPTKARATGCLLFGIFLVFVGWPIFGIALEVFGLLNLFGNMFPVILVILRQMPVIGDLIPGGNRGKATSKRKPLPRESSHDEYNDGRRGGQDDEERYY
jgi:hypothetical protein